MSSDRWQRLDQLFHEAIALPPNERSRFLIERCADDPSLGAEVERLIAAHERAGSFIEVPPISGVGAWADTLDEPSAVGRRFGPYRVVREIARGGMGAVYLAERSDGQYEQSVAIKLIKRGMDTDLVLQRFRAERQILASFDHPNMSRLLDGGTTEDGRPYFVMEYIEGNPIDEYADARRLSVADRLRLFLEVCNAVSYAHRHLVIHRDIKPANILVTADGVPKLLDFGIAKVLEPGGNEPTSSVTGFRLLTPEYASPEQIEGRHATVVSDVYSLGVVLYELLTGRSPYRLRSRDPLDVVDAVRTTDPERPSTAISRGAVATDSSRRRRLGSDRAAATGIGSEDRLRRQLRGDLDTIVLMALRKESARRYQSVEELAEDIRRHLSGLPVKARPDSVNYRAGKFVHRNRAAVLAASLASAVVLMLSASFITMRARTDPNAESSRLTTGVLTRRDRILVADFVDRSGDTSLAAAVTEAFRVDLTQSPSFQVLSARQVRTTLARMERSPDLALDDSLAREVAVREGVKAFVTGSVSRVAGQYTISAQLVRADKGDLLAAERETAADSTRVIPALDRLSQRLRRRMGESLRAIQATPPLEQVTTASLPALRAYTEGVRTVISGDRPKAIKILERAVALDTGFASAYRVLGITLGDQLEPGRAAAAIDHALANQSRLPFYERYHTIASAAMSNDYDAAIVAYHRILERYPDDVRALNNLALAYANRRQFAAQESLLVRAIALDSTIPSIQTSLAMAQTNSGDFDAARRTLDRVWKSYPKLWNAQIAEIYLATARQDWEVAERQARARLAMRPADTSDALGGLEVLASIILTQGRLSEAERDLRKVLTLSAATNEAPSHLSAALRLANLELRYRMAPDKSLRVLDDAMSRFPMDSIAEADRPYDELARFFASAGQPVRARELIALAEGTRSGRRPNGVPGRHWSLGAIAVAEGRPRDALPDLRQAAATLDCPICVLPQLARVFDALGNRDSSIAVYERYLQTPWEWRFETDDIELGFAMKRLGELYEQRGDGARATAVHERLLRLWSRADGELQPTIALVRQRMSRARE